MEQTTEASQAADERELLDEDGENRAVCTFLMQYGLPGLTVAAMAQHMRRSGWDSQYWPSFARQVDNAGQHLTKAGAQIWIRYLMSLEPAALKAQPAPTEAQDDGLSPVYAWLERSTRNSPAEVANAARTMMAFYQGAEFPEAEQGDPLDTKLPCDVVIGNMTIRKGVSLGVLVGKAQRDNTRLRELLPQPTPEQIAAFNAFLQNHITDAGEIVAAQGEDSARLVAMLVDRDTPPDNRRDVIDHDIRGNPITREMVARASAETGGVKP